MIECFKKRSHQPADTHTIKEGLQAATAGGCAQLLTAKMGSNETRTITAASSSKALAGSPRLHRVVSSVFILAAANSADELASANDNPGVSTSSRTRALRAHESQEQLQSDDERKPKHASRTTSSGRNQEPKKKKSANIKPPKPKPPECVGHTTEWEVCHMGECPVQEMVCPPCTWTEWSEWTTCTCDGLQERRRDAEHQSMCGKPCVGPKVETQTCIAENCKSAKDANAEPIDCELSEWGDWTICDRACGGGQTFREKARMRKNEFGGQPCHGFVRQTLPCNTQPCHISEDCEASQWSTWSACTKTCGADGFQQRTRSLLQLPRNNGRTCDLALEEVRACLQQDGSFMPTCSDEQDCEWKEWEAWSDCSASCDGGERTRERLIAKAPKHGGQLCTALTMNEMASCNTFPCEEPRDCVISRWSDWSACSANCNGVQMRDRAIVKPAEHGGTCFDTSLKEMRSCNHMDCDKNGEPITTFTEDAAPLDCELSEWSYWSECSETCGATGIQKRDRHVQVYAEAGAQRVCNATLLEIRNCPAGTLPSCYTALEAEGIAAAGVDSTTASNDCQWGEWSAWSACDKTCVSYADQDSEQATKKRERRVKQNPGVLGRPCAPHSALEVASCEVPDCECGPCEFGEWAPWSVCDHISLTQTRRRDPRVDHYCGTGCTGTRVEIQHCIPHSDTAVVDCQFSDWSAWSECSAECGGGEKLRTRSILAHATNGGKICEGDLQETAGCNMLVQCGDDCQISDWQAWSECSATCGTGQKSRQRYVLKPASNGKPCHGEKEIDLVEMGQCDSGVMCDALECHWEQWGAWSDCSASCNGHQSRTRVLKPGGGHSLCPASDDTSEVRGCNLYDAKMDLDSPCAAGSNAEDCVDGRWGEWTTFGACSVSCGTGWQKRDRTIQVAANYCGEPVVGRSEEFKHCEERECHGELGKDAPVDCELSEWTAFSECSSDCNGYQRRIRTVAVTAKNGGRPCEGVLDQAQQCNTDCPASDSKDCVLSDWSDYSECTAKCSGGTRRKTRKIVMLPSGDGKGCDPALAVVESCNAEPCTAKDATDCELSPWTEWGRCSKECDGGERMRTRDVKTMPSLQGKACDEGVATQEVEPCNLDECYTAMRCGLGDWLAWSECSVTCGHGERYRERHLGHWKDGYLGLLRKGASGRRLMGSRQGDSDTNATGSSRRGKRKDRNKKGTSTRLSSTSLLFASGSVAGAVAAVLFLLLRKAGRGIRSRNVFYENQSAAAELSARLFSTDEAGAVELLPRVGLGPQEEGAKTVT
ncbi:unnamed protein product [Amoebophrya sp. A120]|nr:unnamed protein product [Amoebophrya sp. A120]|eukprot:GSA120T00020302001.1